MKIPKMTISKLVAAELQSFPYALDKAVTEKFGCLCNSRFDLLGVGNFVTTHNAKGKLKRQVDEYILAYVAGNQELCYRILNLVKSST